MAKRQLCNIILLTIIKHRATFWSEVQVNTYLFYSVRLDLMSINVLPGPLACDFLFPDSTKRTNLYSSLNHWIIFINLRFSNQTHVDLFFLQNNIFSDH